MTIGASVLYRFLQLDGTKSTYYNRTVINPSHICTVSILHMAGVCNTIHIKRFCFMLPSHTNT